ncbi:MAG: hypothetical protein IT308_10855 [Anaerolineaceae bacterium]|nr:hypothetical protein [Anaerolineaceae bacterium]
MSPGFPIELIYRRSIRNWWAPVLAALAGAILGEIVFSQRTPLYQAQGVLSIGIDFTRMGSLTDIEEDQVFGMVGDALFSPTVLSAVVQGTDEEQIDLDEAAFKEIASADRRQHQWVLTIRHTDASAAAKIATIWTEQAYLQINASIAHAENASRLQRYLDSLASCLQYAVVSGPVAGTCDPKNLEELLTEFNEAGTAAAAEKEASLGILPGTTVLLTSIPETPDKAVVFQRGSLILIGSLIGFLAGALISFTGWTDRLRSNRAR